MTIWKCLIHANGPGTLHDNYHLKCLINEEASQLIIRKLPADIKFDDYSDYLLIRFKMRDGKCWEI